MRSFKAHSPRLLLAKGALATSNQVNGAVTAYGTEVLGLNHPYQALSEKLEGATFERTMRYQPTMTVLEFSLTVLFTARLVLRAWAPELLYPGSGEARVRASTA